PSRAALFAASPKKISTTSTVTRRTAGSTRVVRAACRPSARSVRWAPAPGEVLVVEPVGAGDAELAAGVPGPLESPDAAGGEPVRPEQPAASSGAAAIPRRASLAR